MVNYEIFCFVMIQEFLNVRLNDKFFIFWKFCYFLNNAHDWLETSFFKEDKKNFLMKVVNCVFLKR